MGLRGPYCWGSEVRTVGAQRSVLLGLIAYLPGTLVRIYATHSLNLYYVGVQ